MAELIDRLNTGEIDTHDVGAFRTGLESRISHAQYRIADHSHLDTFDAVSERPAGNRVAALMYSDVHNVFLRRCVHILVSFPWWCAGKTSPAPIARLHFGRLHVPGQKVFPGGGLTLLLTHVGYVCDELGEAFVIWRGL